MQLGVCCFEVESDLCFSARFTDETGLYFFPPFIDANPLLLSLPDVLPWREGESGKMPLAAQTDRCQKVSGSLNHNHSPLNANFIFPPIKATSCKHRSFCGLICSRAGSSFSPSFLTGLFLQLPQQPIICLHLALLFSYRLTL